MPYVVYISVVIMLFWFVADHLEKIFQCHVTLQRIGGFGVAPPLKIYRFVSITSVQESMFLEQLKQVPYVVHLVKYIDGYNSHGDHATPKLLMEYVEGGTLQKKVERCFLVGPRTYRLCSHWPLSYNSNDFVEL